MSKGTHWEWRVFGTLSDSERKRVEKQCSEDVREKILIDEYLWHDECRANVKIRKNKLKIKYLTQSTEDECQLWREDKTSKFTFPLKRAAIERIEKEMGVTAPNAVQSMRASIAGFKAALPLFLPPLRILAIHKHRFLYAFTHQDIPFHLEIAHVSAPVERWSICIESPDVSMQPTEASLSAFRGARDHLELPPTMQVMGYVEFLTALDKQRSVATK